MKKIYSALLAVIAALAMAVSSFAAAITIDGSYSAREWEGCESAVIAAHGVDSNCDVDYAVMRSKMCTDENAAYFLFSVETANDICEAKHGVRLSVCGSQSVEMYAGNSPLSYDVELYNFRSFVSLIDSNSFVCEVRVGFKNGMPAQIPLKIRFTDGSGIPSNVYSVMIETQKPPEEAQSSATEKTTTCIYTTTEFVTHIYTAYPGAAETRKTSSSVSSKTTKHKTTKAKTTKAEKATKFVENIKKVSPGKTDSAATLSPEIQTAETQMNTITIKPLSEQSKNSQARKLSGRMKAIVAIGCAAAIILVTVWNMLPINKKSAATDNEKTK